MRIGSRGRRALIGGGASALAIVVVVLAADAACVPLMETAVDLALDATLSGMRAEVEPWARVEFRTSMDARPSHDGYAVAIVGLGVG